ncbi:MAG: MlaD family protein [Bacteroidales bacterium]|nr:MlaD family protein [Bacteroidales bacterium]
MKISREFKVGFIFIAAIAIFVWGFNLLKGTNILSGKRFLYAVYDRVDGLEKDNKVLINGLNIGKVSRLAFIPETSKIIVELYIQNEVNIPDNSVANIYGADLLGTKAIEIRFGNSSTYVQNYDTLISALEQSLMDQVNEQVEPLKRKALALINSIDSTMSDIQSVFNEDTRSNLTSTIENIKKTLSNTESATYKIDHMLTDEQPRIISIMQNLESITANLDQNSENINRILSNFASLSDSLAASEIPQTMREAQEAVANLKSITQKINNGEGSLGQLMTNDSLYIQLEKSSSSLNLLLEDIRLNPKKYVKFSVF